MRPRSSSSRLVRRLLCEIMYPCPQTRSMPAPSHCSRKAASAIHCSTAPAAHQQQHIAITHSTFTTQKLYERVLVTANFLGGYIYLCTTYCRALCLNLPPVVALCHTRQYDVSIGVLAKLDSTAVVTAAVLLLCTSVCTYSITALLRPSQPGDMYDIIRKADKREGSQLDLYEHPYSDSVVFCRYHGGRYVRTGTPFPTCRRANPPSTRAYAPAFCLWTC